MAFLCAIISSTIAASAACVTDLDCSNNGVCASGGRCNCDPAWLGAACSTLNLLPATRGHGLHSADAPVHNTSSWGGSVLKGEDGRYHMWASELVNHCGLNLWTSNSHVVHAVASEPDAAYAVVDEVHGVFSHEPSLVRGPGGEYVMYFIMGHPITAFDDPVQPCVCDASGVGGSSPMCDTSATWRNGTFMMYAASPDGPWSAPLEVLPHPLGPVDSNLAVVIAANGSLVGLTRKIPSGPQGSEIHLLTAADWKDKSTYKQAGVALFPDSIISNFGLEDPYVYLDTKGRYHAIFHNMLNNDDQTTCGSHATSDDGIAWTFTGTAYGNKVQYTDGTSTTFSRRERPHLIINDQGQPTHLTTGVVAGDNKGCCDDNSYTHVQPIQEA